ncbi:amidase [Elioraea rosea]|uniref:amidase n=1 Tax=Elioraea rosea TaxID=2492390 RepID=UPI001182E4E3|nr:amidase family protein [Elioraea rosea]
MTDTALCDLSAIEQRRLIGRRAISPVDLLDAHLRRIEQVNHAVNAVVSIDEGMARSAAKAAEAAVVKGEALPLLHGLPVGIKDLEETKGLRTTYGSPQYADFVPEADCGMVANLRAAGAIILGKTNTPEFGAGANTVNPVFGPTGNPFDPARSCAGSSGGSAVALATGMVPLASGSDLGGSLRNPAAYCGIVGYRPSPGLVPSEKRGLGWYPSSMLGPMARSVPDLAFMLAAMASDDPRDPLSRAVFGRRMVEQDEFHPLKEQDPGTLRVAYTPDFGVAPTSNQGRALFADRIGRFKGIFHSASEGSPDMSGADRAFGVLRAEAFLAKHLPVYNTARHMLGPNVIENVEEGLRYTLADMAEAHTLHTAIYRRTGAFFKDVDLIISPAMTVQPTLWTELAPREIDGRKLATYYSWLALPYAVTLSTHPAIVLPCGVDERGLPFGIQIVGPRGGDAFVLAAAAAIERALAGIPACARPVPNLDALSHAPSIHTLPGADMLAHVGKAA